MGKKKRDTQPAYIYVLSCDNEYKIGYSKDVAQRVKTLQTARSTPIKILYTMRVQDAEKAERFLHSVCIGDRKGGEWFDLSSRSKELLEMIFNQAGDLDQLKRVGLVPYEQ